MRLLSISSQVVAGHVGNAALALPLARLGVELLAVPSVLFSNHPGHGRFTGRALPTPEVAALLEGLAAGGFLTGLDALLTGYLGSAETAAVAGEAAARLKRAEPALLVLVDPVLGDGGRLYVAAGIETVLRARLLPLADLVTPNAFELERLSGLPAATLPQQLAAARQLLAQGPRAVLVTSADAGAERAACLLATAAGAWLLATPRLRFEVAPNGAGDLLAGLLLREALCQPDLVAAARLALARLFAVLRITEASGSRELALLAAQEALVAAQPEAVSLEPLA